MINKNITTTEKINFPLLELMDGESTIIIPESHDLTPRTFFISYFNNSYNVVENETDKSHRVDKDVIEDLSSLSFEDEEICELLVYIHECLHLRNIRKKYKHIAASIKMIYRTEESAISLLKKFKDLSIDEVVEVMTSKSPAKTFKEMTYLFDSDDYGDGNHEE